MINVEHALQNLINSKLLKGYYDSSDIILVRDTDFLPHNRIIWSISNIPFVCKSTLDANRAIKIVLMETNVKLKELKRKYQKAQDNIKIQILQEISNCEKEITELAREYTPLATQYRSTVHFCLNGLVSNHGNNVWNGKYVILEPFKYHDKDDNIEAVRPEDTYFKDKVVLSKEAIILINEKYKDEVLLSYNTEYNYIFYTGSKEQAVKNQLIKMQVVPEIINEHNVKDSKTSVFLKQFIRKNIYNTDKHSLSLVYEEDDRKSLILWEKYQLEFIQYLSLFIFNDDLVIKLNNVESSSKEKVALFVQVIQEIGLENYKRIVFSFNQNIMEKILNKNFPTNNEILAGESFIDLEDFVLR